MGFAAGALGATQRYFETQRAQEAERLKEERLAAIRASERAEDRAFQIAQTDRTIAAQDSRDQRTIEAQTARDEREAARRMEELKAQGVQRERELGISRDTQLAVAETYGRPQAAEATRYLVLRDGSEIEVAGNERKAGDRTLMAITPGGQYVPLRSASGTDRDTSGVSQPMSQDAPVDRPVVRPAPRANAGPAANMGGNGMRLDLANDPLKQNNQIYSPQDIMYGGRN